MQRGKKLEEGLQGWQNPNRLGVSQIFLQELLRVLRAALTSPRAAPRVTGWARGSAPRGWRSAAQGFSRTGAGHSPGSEKSSLTLKLNKPR